MFSCCAVIPVYNHEHAVAQTVEKVLTSLPVILIDDGSRDSCKTVLQDISQNHQQVTLVTRDQNGGKGAAV